MMMMMMMMTYRIRLTVLSWSRCVLTPYPNLSCPLPTPSHIIYHQARGGGVKDSIEGLDFALKQGLDQASSFVSDSKDKEDRAPPMLER